MESSLEASLEASSPASATGLNRVSRITLAPRVGVFLEVFLEVSLEVSFEVYLEVSLEISLGVFLEAPRGTSGTGHCLSHWSLVKGFPHLVLELEHGVLLGEGAPVLPLDDGGEVGLVVIVLVLQLDGREGALPRADWRSR